MAPAPKKKRTPRLHKIVLPGNKLNFVQRKQNADEYQEALNECKLREWGPERVFNYFQMESNPRWPHVTLTQLKARYHGKINNYALYETRKALLPSEEAELVEFCKISCRMTHPLTDEELGEQVLHILRSRHAINQTAGPSKRKPLSHQAREILATSNVSPHFINRFKIDHALEINSKTRQHFEIERAKALTSEKIEKDLAELVSELKRLGIADENGKIADPRRVLNTDETPQPLDCQSENANAKKVLAGVGEKASTLRSNSHAQVTITPTIDLAGNNYPPQFIFGDLKSYAKEEVPFPNCLISLQENGFQSGTTFLALVKKINAELIKRNVPKPVLWKLDGHISRFNIEVLRALKAMDIHPFLIRPHSSTVTQEMDKINWQIHDRYNKALANWRKIPENKQRQVNLEVFAQLMARIWPVWNENDIISAWKKVGITKDGVNFNLVDKSQFEISTIFQPSPSPPLPEIAEKANKIKEIGNIFERLPPPKENCVEYVNFLEDQIEDLKVAYHEISSAGLFNSPPRPTEQPGSGRKKRIIDVWGSLEGHQVLEKLETKEKEEALKKTESAKKKTAQLEQRKLLLALAEKKRESHVVEKLSVQDLNVLVRSYGAKPAGKKAELVEQLKQLERSSTAKAPVEDEAEVDYEESDDE
eukprot:Pompholyxophrys_sp_v1_NODE_55_length_2838_cov_7.592526.p1 type:complete len:650 gc:universal NODE_55_length_2838_cov_7.592526:2024-75(-)